MTAQAVPLPKSQVRVKTVLTVALTLVAVAFAVLLVIHARFALILTLTSLFLAVALNRPVDFLTRHKVKRGAAVAMVMTAVLAGLVGVGLLLIPPMVSQGKSLVEHAPDYLKKVQASPLYEKIDARIDIDAKVEKLKTEAPQRLTGAVDPALKAVSSVLTGFTALITLLFLTLFMLLFGGPVVKGLLEESVPQRRFLYERVVSKAYRSIGGYLSGLSVVCLTNAILTSTFLAIIRVPYFLPLGVLSGLSSLVPLAGNTLAGVVITAIGLAVGGPVKGALCAGFCILYQQFENQLLGPVVYRRTLDINPLVIIVSLLFFAEIAGVPGAILAVPIVACAQVVLREALLLRRERLGLPLAGAASYVGNAAGADDLRAATDTVGTQAKQEAAEACHDTPLQPPRS